MSQVQAKIIYAAESLVETCNADGVINCDQLKNTAKAAWLTFNDGIIPVQLVFKDPLEDDAIKGVWLDIAGRGILIDGAVDDFVSKCNSCCGENAVVTPVYNGVYPTSVAPVAKTYTVTRTDNGTLWDTENVALNYLKYAIPGSTQRTSRNNSTGVSTYTFQSYKFNVVPQAQNNNQAPDTLVQTPMTFDSNVPAALAGNQYSFTLKVNNALKGTPTPVLNATSLAALATALNANATYAAYGSYSVVAGAIRLTTTVVDNAVLAIAVVSL